MSIKLSLALFGVGLAWASFAHAGDVRLTQHGGAVKLTSVQDFELTLTSVPSGGGDPVMGKVAVSPGLGSTVNGSMEVLKLIGVDSISVSVRGGDGQSDIGFNGLAIPKKLSFQGGDGVALVGLADCVIGGDVSIHAGRGNLSLEGAGNEISGKLDVKGGPSPDDVMLGASVGRDAKIALGEGSNESSFSGAVERSLTMKGGSFTDVTALSGVVANTLKIDQGSGSNWTDVGAVVIHGKASYKGKDSSDSLLIAGSIFQGDVALSLGNGENDVTLDDAVFDADLSVKGGSGTDNVTLTGGTTIGGKASYKLGGGTNTSP